MNVAPGATQQLRILRRNRATVTPSALDFRRAGDSGRRRSASRSEGGRERRRGQLVRLTAAVPVRGAMRRAAVQRCYTFLPLLAPVRLAVPDPSGTLTAQQLDALSSPRK